MAINLNLCQYIMSKGEIALAEKPVKTDSIARESIPQANIQWVMERLSLKTTIGKRTTQKSAVMKERRELKVIEKPQGASRYAIRGKTHGA